VPTNPVPDSKRAALAAIGIVLLPLLCCGLPLFIAAGALGAVGSVLGNPWVITAAIVLVLGVVFWRVRRFVTTTSGEQCCPPRPPMPGPPQDH
jgi:hypothetical protein